MPGTEPPESLRTVLRRKMRARLSTLLAWYVARGLLSPSFAYRLLRSGRSFQIPEPDHGMMAFEVLVRDDYHMSRRRLEASDVVIDVGGHIGCFGLAAHACGSRRIYSYEPFPDSFERLESNYAGLPGAEAVQAAVFRSDDKGPAELDHPGFATGGSVLFSPESTMEWVEGEIRPSHAVQAHKAPALALDDLLAPHSWVRLLKVDCEGSEFPILLTSRLLDRVDEIVAEVHELPHDLFAKMIPAARVSGYDEYNLPVLSRFLDEQGFTVTSSSVSANVRLIQATRRPA